MKQDQRLQKTIQGIVAQRDGDTLASILGSDLVRAYAKTATGDLSDSQRAIVTTTVSLMQDRLVRLLEENLERIRQDAILEKQFLVAFAERTQSVRAGLAELYAHPFFSASRTTGNTDESKTQGLRRFVSWGNALSLFTVVLFAVALYFTKAYASYKDRVDIQSKEIAAHAATIQRLETYGNALEDEKKDLTAKLSASLEKESIERGKYISLQAEYDSIKVQFQALNEGRGAESVLQKQLDERTREVSNARARNEKLSADIVRLTREKTSAESESADYRRRWQDSQKSYNDLTSSMAALRTDNDRLRRELDEARRRQR